MLDRLADTPLFKSLHKDTVTEISKFSKIKKYAKGDILFYERDDDDTLFYILEGSLKFYKVDRFENEIFLYKLPNNSLIFDLFKLCEEYMIQCFSNAEFLEDSEVLEIDSQKFRNLMSEDLVLTKNVLKESFFMVRQMQCVISRDIVFDGTAKVAHMIATELENFNVLKKHEIAYMLHIQPETLSRILKKLVRTEAIEIQKSRVYIKNLKKLKEIYE